MINVKINGSSILEPQHEGDAGYDVIAFSEPNIVGDEVDKYFYSRIDYIEYDTNLILAPDKGVHTLVFPRSSISNKNLVLANSVGLIDNGYRGTVKIRFKYIAQPQDFVLCDNGDFIVEVDYKRIYAQGDRIAQLVFSETLPVKLKDDQRIDLTDRNTGGFGSTGV